MSGTDINRLLILTARGDDTAFSDLYLSTRRGVYAFLYSYFHNREDTEDAMQTVYLKIKTNAKSFQADTNGRAWILQIAKNHALNVLKKNKREASLDDIKEPAAHGVAVGAVTDAMQRCLSEEEQRVVILHVLWGYRHREIAKMLDCPTGTITSKYKRAIAKLKTELKEEKP